MKGRLIFMLEEPSMKVLLDSLVPRVLPGWQPNQHFLCVKHEGKSDLDKSLPRKLKAWQSPGDRFMIVRDNDNADCSVVKRNYELMCQSCGRPDTVIRLVCQELEAWYLGDLHGLADLYADPKLASPAMYKRYAQPDEWQKPSAELDRHVRNFQKSSAARGMASRLNLEQNRSRSFQVFLEGVRRMANGLR